jgi:hypothetical protein
VSDAEATRRTMPGTPKALDWLASDMTLMARRRATARDVRRWLAANMPGVLAERLAAWDDASPYRRAEQQQRWRDPDQRLARWEQQRERREGGP